MGTDGCSGRFRQLGGARAEDLLVGALQQHHRWQAIDEMR
jgi:hypothetical protein